MLSSIEILLKGQIRLRLEVPVNDQKPYFLRAAQTLSMRHPIKGFRPGNVPLEIAQKEYGEQQILEEALSEIVSATLSKAVEEHHLITVGSPEIEISKANPNESIVFLATVSILPTVTIGDMSSIKVEKKPILVEEKEVDHAIDELRSMQVKEAAVARGIEANDRVLVDMNMRHDGVDIEGGKTTNHNILMDKDYYVPGLKEKLLTVTKGTDLKFTLPFPKDNFQKNLAGKNIEFEINVKEVYDRQLPEADDAFAKNLGQETITSLKKLLEQNIKSEKEQKETDRYERALLEAAIEKATFDAIPEVMITDEAHKMMKELEDHIVHQGMEIDKYFESIHKKRDDVFIGFAPEALKRVKVALLLRAIALEQEITTSQEDILKEIERIRELYKHDQEAQKVFLRPEIHTYVENMLRNRRAIEWLCGKVQQTN